MTILAITYCIIAAYFVALSTIFYLYRPKNDIKEKRIRAALVLMSFVWPVLGIYLYSDWVLFIVANIRTYLASRKET